MPGPPLDVEVSEVTKESAVITWKAPESDGGSPITGYVVERSLAASARFLRVNKQPVTELKLKVEELVEDNEYVFRVIAENKIGPGEPSEPSKPVMARDPWRKYTILCCSHHHYYQLLGMGAAGMGKRGHLPSSGNIVKCFCALVVHQNELFMHYFHKLSSASGVYTQTPPVLHH